MLHKSQPIVSPLLFLNRRQQRPASANYKLSWPIKQIHDVMINTQRRQGSCSLLELDI